MRAERRRSIRRARDRGQSLVEFAIVLPILLLLLSGVIDVGRILFTYIALTDAAQEGAIFAAHEPTSAATIVDRVRSSSNHGEVTSATVVVACTASPAPGTVSVTVSHELALLTPVASQILGGSVLLSATVIGTNFKEICG